MNARNLFRSLVLIAGALSASCGGGGRDEIAPALIIQTNTLSPTITIDTFETIEGTQIFGEGVGPGPFSTCGHLLSISAYRTDTDLVFRIEDKFGFCWDSDIYSIWITGITWRKVPSTLILANNGSPEVNEAGLALFRSAGGQGSDPKVPARQWIDDPTDGWFYISIPLDVFSFYVDVDDRNSTFPVYAIIDRFTPNVANPVSSRVLDWTDPINVNFVDPDA